MGLKISELIGAMLMMVIGLALTPTIASSATTSATALANFSSAATLVELLPLLYVVVIIAGAVGYIVLKVKSR